MNNQSFEIKQIKIEHFYWNSNEVGPGVPVSTSIELFINELNTWKKRTTHNYHSIYDTVTIASNKQIEDLNELNIIDEIKKYDLTSLKNNYFTDKQPENLSHWELTYNYLFKIVGTYDQEIDILKKISELLKLNDIMDEEQLKVKDDINS